MRSTGTGGIYLAVLAAFMFLCGALPTVAECSGPRIEVSPTDFSFGRIPNDKNVEHVFKVRNTGDRPLVITSVNTSCGCTAAMMDSSVIEPGGSGNLRVTFSPRGGHVPVTRSINIASNDPAQKALVLRISADPYKAEEEKPAVPFKRTHERKARLEFDGKCAKCHVPPRAGMTGKKLYLAACARCHGDTGQGIRVDGEVLGAALLAPGSVIKTDEGLIQVITAGTGHPWMPGFGAEYGGPLSEKQVKSLVKLVKNKFKEK